MQSSTELPRGTVTFLFTDIEGSTKLWQQHPDAMPAALACHHSLLQHAVESHTGYVFQIIGDAFCAAFSTARDGLDAALAAQRALRDEPWGETGAIRVRMALHTGAAEVRAGEFTSGEYVSGLTLSRVARLLSAGHGGQILLSLPTAELVRDHLPKDVTLRDLGARRLKDLIRPGQIFQVCAPDLPVDFAPLKTLDVHPHNLPVQLTSFVGREREMSDVKRLLTTTHLLTLTGAGGTGKTRLSLQVAADFIDEFPDGVWFVELAPLTDPGLIPQTVASVLGLREEAGRPAMTMLSDYLRAKTVLLLLDNCEHLIEACAKFADTILRAAPKVKILATSREALGIAGETAYRVPSLSLPPIQLLTSNVQSLTQYESVRLFIDRALAVQPDFSVTNANAPSLAQICHRLDGIPLALELAAARVKSLSVEQIAARLDDRFRLLTGGSRAALPRQQTLRAAIDWSHSLLTDEERILLRRLAVFAGGSTLEAAQAVCSCDPVCAEDVLDLLARLVDKSLVLFEQRDSATRYRLMETIRQYARDRLLESGEAATVRGRHLDYYLKLAQAAEPKLHGSEQFVMLDTLELEHNNLRAALEWSQGEGKAEQGLELAAALLEFWELNAGWSEGRELVANLLIHPQVAAKNLIRANGLLVAGVINWRLGDPKAGRWYLEELGVIARELGEPGKKPLALALGYLGHIVFGDDFSRGESMVEEGLAIARSLGTRWLIAQVLRMKGSCLRGRRDLPAAQKVFEESLALYQSIGDKRNAALSMHGIGGIFFRQHDYATARRYVEQSLLFAREIKDRQSIMSNLGTLGEIERVEGKYDLAKRVYLEGLEIAREIGHMGMVMALLQNLGAIALHGNEIDSAKSFFTEGLALARELNNQSQIAYSLMEFAGMLAMQRKAERAAQLLAVVQTFIASGDVRYLSPADEQEYEHYLTLTRAQLDEVMFNAAWAEGQKLTLEQAVELAMS